ncbi:hypothetical protein S40288_07049 [Stachybotrys chartarum IBT 40288]|nr:hypothetical protein S40288_07049 [Stachybotrys chartarum IBT 40288]
MIAVGHGSCRGRRARRHGGIPTPPATPPPTPPATPPTTPPATPPPTALATPLPRFAANSCLHGITPTVQNVTATVDLQCPLNLDTIHLLVRNAEYNAKRFKSVIIRIRKPKTTALVFASGKMVVTGAKSEADSELASRKYTRIISNLGFNVEFERFKIQNIVGSCDVKFHIELERLASRHGDFCSYKPGLFCGLIYRLIEPKIVLIIFYNGKVVITGAKVKEDIYRGFERIYPILQDSREYQTSLGVAFVMGGPEEQGRGGRNVPPSVQPVPGVLQMGLVEELMDGGTGTGDNDRFAVGHET